MGVDETRHQEFAPAVEDAGIGVRRPESGFGGRVGRDERDAVALDADGTRESAGFVAHGGHGQNGGVGEEKRSHKPWFYSTQLPCTVRSSRPVTELE